MNTKCEKCVFAITENQQQIGCLFDIPETITNQYGAIYPKNKTIINIDHYWKLMNFTCPLALTTEGKAYLTNNGADEKQIGNLMLELTRHKYYLIYFLDDDLNNLRLNLNQLSAHFCKPTYMSFVKKTNTNLPTEIMNILNEYNISPWKLHHIVEQNMTDSGIIDMILDTNIGNQDTNAFSIWYNHYYIPNDYFDKINETMNYFLNKSAYIESNSEQFNGVFVPFSAYLNHHKKINLTMQSLKEDPVVHRLQVL